ncbi:DUF5906 domain-containing protein [Marivita sp.]|uniref:DUF5906 domain-containing protein n=1 Tax=Marivita sp. TaxID=2003365 RepID=UPI003F72859C
MDELTKLYGLVENAFISVNLIDPVTRKFSETKFFSTQELASAAAYSLTQAQDLNAYHSFHLLGKVPESGRGRSEDFAASIGVFLDVDIRQGDKSIHAADDRCPSSLEEVLEVFDEFELPRPPRIIDSGNGFYFQFLFDEPFLYPDQASRLRFEVMSKAFHEKIALAFKSRGWVLDPVYDLSRITRMPGTLNHKTNPPKPVSLVEDHPERRLPIQEFVRFGANSQNAPSKAYRPRENNARRAEGEASFEAIRTACPAIDDLVKRADKHSYNEWLAVGAALVHCQDGENKFHEISSADPRYDADETQKLFESLNGPTSCNHLKEVLACTQCTSCVHSTNRHVGSPIAFGDCSTEQAELLSTMVFATKRERFFRVSDKESFSKMNVNDQHMRYMKSPATTLLSDKRMRVVETAGYYPGRIDVLIEADSGPSFNLWRSSELVAMPGDASIITNHIAEIIPNEVDRSHLLDSLAHSVQKPWVKINHAIFIIGSQGIGKSFLTELLQALFGYHNVCIVKNKELTSDFNAPMGNRQVLVLEEISVADKIDTYNELKPWITEEEIMVNEKNVPQYVATTPRLIIGYSNHELPIKIEESDRRFMFIVSPAEEQDQAYYLRLFADGIAQAPAFLHLLLNRDISSYAPKARPPMTAAKRRIISESKPAVARTIEEMVANKEWPLSEEIFQLDDLMWEVKQRISGPANRSMREFTRTLTKLGYVQASENQIRTSSGRHRFWAKADSQWVGADPQFLARQWDQQSRAA